MYASMKMFVIMYKSHLQILVLKHHTLPHCSLIRPVVHTFSTKTMIPTNVDSSDFKISFLKNKCGLSGKALVRASNCLNFDSSDQRPDKVLELFRNFGFTHPNITRIVTWYPFILYNYHPQYVIRPKLDFLLSFSQSQADVVAIVTKNPSILTCSLDNRLIPSLNLLNSVTGSYTNTLSVLKYNQYILTRNIPKYFLLNTQILIKLGVPHSQILKLLRSYGPVLGTQHHKFRNFLLKLTDMGCNLESSNFCKAVRTLCCVSDSTWKSTFVLFRSFGFSDHEILSMFKKMPEIMSYTDKLINEKLEFFLNKLQWTPLRLSSYPFVLYYSLKKRTIPRCSVLQVLVSKNRTSESYMVSSILVMTESQFIKNFVTSHKDEVPEVLEACQGKLSFDEYTFKQKGQLRLKSL